MLSGESVIGVFSFSKKQFQNRFRRALLHRAARQMARRFLQKRARLQWRGQPSRRGARILPSNSGRAGAFCPAKRIGNSMKNFLRVIAHMVYVLGAFVVIIVPANKYDWMLEAELAAAHGFEDATGQSAQGNPGTAAATAHGFEDTAGNNLVFIALVCGIMVFIQITLIVMADEARQKTASMVLVLLALVVLGSKFIA
ncbi:MAG: hypothetical protein LBP52_07715 [Burkholderiaceae bacterium]|jgi:hypothetical protein|nr:hypothetical protein [Burkholderiaceae bacterium]